MFINKMMMESWQKITMVAGARHFYAHSIEKMGILSMTKRKTSGFTLLMQGFR
jgi:hypothetical protein